MKEIKLRHIIAAIATLTQLVLMIILGIGFPIYAISYNIVTGNLPEVPPFTFTLLIIIFLCVIISAILYPEGDWT